MVNVVCIGKVEYYAIPLLSMGGCERHLCLYGCTHDRDWLLGGQLLKMPRPRTLVQGPFYDTQTDGAPWRQSRHPTLSWPAAPPLFISPPAGKRKPGTQERRVVEMSPGHWQCQPKRSVYLEVEHACHRSLAGTESGLKGYFRTSPPYVSHSS